MKKFGNVRPLSVTGATGACTTAGNTLAATGEGSTWRPRPRGAGGRVTTLNGQDDFVRSREVLATNGLLHEPMVALLKQGASRSP